MQRVQNIRAQLGRSYDVRGVSDFTIADNRHVLRVSVWLPERLHANERAREAQRAEIASQARALATPLSAYDAVQVLLLSGYDLGVAHWTTTN